MSNLYVSIAVLAAYIGAGAAIHLRLCYLDRQRAHKRRIRQIKAYTMRKPDRRFSVELLGAGDWPQNVVSLDTYSRRVDAA